jgi:hypothetical protein
MSKKHPFIALDIYAHGSIETINDEDNLDMYVPDLINYQSLNIHSITKIGQSEPGCRSIIIHSKNEIYNNLQPILDQMETPCDIVSFLELYVHSAFKHNTKIQKLLQECRYEETTQENKDIIQNLLLKYNIMASGPSGEYIVQDYRSRKNPAVTRHTLFQYNRDDIYPRQGLYEKLYTGEDKLTEPFMDYLKMKGYPVKMYKNDNNKEIKYIYLSDILKHISKTYPDADVFIIDRSCNRFRSSAPIDMAKIAPPTVINGGRGRSCGRSKSSRKTRKRTKNRKHK